jgi:CheY-like chemotaxis protein
MSLKILVVDDNDGVREAVAMLLKELGYTVIDASGPAAAIDYLRADATIQVVLTDLNMPQGEGILLARRAKGINPQVEVLLMTTEQLLDEWERQEVISAGIRRIIPKPGFEGLEDELELLQKNVQH